jgi:hypothetical protein
VVVRFRGSGVADLSPHVGHEAGTWTVLLTSEDPPFSPECRTPRVETASPAPVVTFGGPSAVILRWTKSAM